jgi:gamma-glutamyltranspeptidase/glutathione hydrolase
MAARQWAAQQGKLSRQPGFAEAYLPGGRTLTAGERFYFPEHATTLESIATTRGAAFFTGELAEKMEWARLHRR